jgi:hypothetical protein
MSRSHLCHQIFLALYIGASTPVDIKTDVQYLRTASVVYCQSSWLQIRRPGFDSRHYQKKKVVGLERGPLSLVSTTEEILDRKVAAPV